MYRIRQSLLVLGVTFVATAAHADIFQWEYINPADPSQGKRQSTTLAPDGAGADWRVGNLSGRNLTMAYLIGANLRTYIEWDLFSYLIATKLNQADLSGANFDGAYLTNADLTGAEIRGASFNVTFDNHYGLFGGLTLAQLYSTASYQAHDLSGISLWRHNLAGANFAGQKLTNVQFVFATLTDADFTGSDIRGAHIGSGLSLAQLYSTASYQAHDLSGVMLGGNLAGANFAGQNLTNAKIGGATLTGANFTAADVRGAFLPNFPANAITTNLISHDGHINGLVLDSGVLLAVRDYHPGQYNPSQLIPINVKQHFVMGSGGRLRVVFEADAWDSTISFAPGIPVALGGTLELTFADDVNLASQVGHTFDLFNWTGVTPTGAFAVSSPYAWDLSNLYTTGQVTLTAIPEPTTVVLLALASGICVKRRQPIAFV